MNSKFLLIFSLFFLFNCVDEKQEKSTLFETLNFENSIQDTDSLNILNYLYFYNGAGVSVGNVVGDSLPDIYLVSNLGENKLFENKGNFTFEDVTAKANLKGKATWQTGTSMVDINNDGLLDIFVCAVSGIHQFIGKNEVYINQGNGTFVEQAEQLGLNQENYSTAVAFLDFDSDGDLDLYLLNHAVHTEDGYRLPADKIRSLRDEKAGDKLFRNDSGQFTDISDQAGILGSKINYGLAVRVSDINSDGWPDIYVSNDFHENDYLYINQQNGTFELATENYLSYTTKFSMGNDIGDINNDGSPDIFVADMQPNTEKILKATPPEDSPEIFDFKLKHGYHYQYAHNSLQINTPTGFQEAANLYNVASSDWSWSPLLEDFDQDGKLDLFVSNGILRRPNDLDFLNYLSTAEVAKQLASGNQSDVEIIEQMPSGLWYNFMFIQTEHGFVDNSEVFGFTEADSSNGSAVADFDGDGDLDIIMNRLNSPAIIWNNPSNKNYLTIQLNAANQTVYGTKVKVTAEPIRLTKEFYPQRGFMSSSDPLLSFGLGNKTTVQSIKITWPNGTTTVKNNVQTNQVLTFTMPENNGEVRAKINQTLPENRPVVYQSNKFLGNNLIPYSSFLSRKKLVQSAEKYTVITSEWNKVVIKNALKEIENNAPKGFWQHIYFYDKDGDGDLDVLLGNLGNNSRLKASTEFPLLLYQKDVDDNGSLDYIFAFEKNGTYYPVLGKNQLAKQMPFINKKYTSFADFAGQSVEQVFENRLKGAIVFEIESLKNGWLINNAEKFIWEELPFNLQAGPITESEITENGLLVKGIINDFIPEIGKQELRAYIWNGKDWTYEN